ncbi:MFS transporter [Planobispora siamensis]|uniref:MFS transporter n=1 Tax=Planobispora siamensis TaxID=936338 RepID=A0A8J3WPV8_9ACTN|nr:MFS transporter [Planobispora siamensis]GIH97683.1 MFS transporter [Planobispora siamensis]
MSALAPPAKHGGDLLRFAGIWCTSLLSTVGSALSTFVLGVWTLQTTGSVTAFALLMLASTLPGILAGPLAGVVADRFDRRRVLIAADTINALPTAAVGVLTHTGDLAVWHLYASATIGAVCGAFHLTAYQAMTPLLVAERQLGRINGLMQLGFAVQVCAPVIAAALLASVGVTGVILLDLVTFALAVTTLSAVRLPARVLRPPVPAEPPALRADLLHGWRHLRSRRGLLELTLVFTAYNFLFGAAGVLIQPLILSFSSVSTLGVLMLAGGCGVLAGSVLMTAWGGPRRTLTGVTVFTAVGGVALIAHAPWPAPVPVGVAAAVFLFTLPVVQACGRTIMQMRIEPERLGRVMGTFTTLGQLAMPVAYLCAAPLTERLAEPLLRPGAALASSVGALTGTGPGRGIAAVFLLTGAAMLALAALTARLPALRALAEPALEGASAPSGMHDRGTEGD